MPQSYVCLPIHVVFSTKNRAPLIQAEWEGRLYEYCGGLLRAEKCVLLAAGGMPDHVHFLVSWSKERSISDVMRVLKTNSSKNGSMKQFRIKARSPGKTDMALSQSVNLMSKSSSATSPIRKSIIVG